MDETALLRRLQALIEQAERDVSHTAEWLDSLSLEAGTAPLSPMVSGPPPNTQPSAATFASVHALLHVSSHPKMTSLCAQRSFVSMLAHTVGECTTFEGGFQPTPQLTTLVTLLLAFLLDVDLPALERFLTQHEGFLLAMVVPWAGAAAQSRAVVEAAEHMFAESLHDKLGDIRPSVFLHRLCHGQPLSARLKISLAWQTLRWMEYYGSCTPLDAVGFALALDLSTCVMDLVLYGADEMPVRPLYASSLVVDTVFAALGENVVVPTAVHMSPSLRHGPRSPRSKGAPAATATSPTASASSAPSAPPYSRDAQVLQLCAFLTRLMDLEALTHIPALTPHPAESTAAATATQETTHTTTAHATDTLPTPPASLPPKAPLAKQGTGTHFRMPTPRTTDVKLGIAAVDRPSPLSTSVTAATAANAQSSANVELGGSTLWAGGLGPSVTATAMSAHEATQHTLATLFNDSSLHAASKCALVQTLQRILLSSSSPVSERCQCLKPFIESRRGLLAQLTSEENEDVVNGSICQLFANVFMHRPHYDQHGHACVVESALSASAIADRRALITWLRRESTLPAQVSTTVAMFPTNAHVQFLASLLHQFAL